VTVRDTAGLSATAFVTVTIVPVNDRPEARVGTNAVVDEGASVTLDGSASHDVDGDTLSYSWTQIAGPPVDLHGAASARPDFIAPDVPIGGATLTFRLVVFDGQEDSDAAEVNIAVRNSNHAPVADAGAAQRVGAGTSVSLDGSLSFDPDGDSVTFAWTQVTGPAVDLLDADSARPSFVAPFVAAVSVLSFELVVSDGTSQATDRVEVTVDPGNRAPIANAGADRTVHEGDAVTLDGSGSSDPDADPLTYRWAQVAGPPVVLSDLASPRPSFHAPEVTSTGDTLTFELVANDGILDSSPDRVSVSVLDQGSAPVCTTAQASPVSLWPPNHQMVPVTVTGVAGAVAIAITRVMQDEPTSGTGDGDTGPDAILSGGRLLLRSERADGGNGRVYTISFIAKAKQGLSCTGSVQVEIRIDPQVPAVNDGARYYSAR